MKNIILLVMVVLVVSCTTTQKPAPDPLSQTKNSNYVVQSLNGRRGSRREQTINQTN